MDNTVTEKYLYLQALFIFVNSMNIFISVFNRSISILFNVFRDSEGNSCSAEELSPIPREHGGAQGFSVRHDQTVQ